MYIEYQQQLLLRKQSDFIHMVDDYVYEDHDRLDTFDVSKVWEYVGWESKMMERGVGVGCLVEVSLYNII